MSSFLQLENLNDLLDNINGILPLLLVASVIGCIISAKTSPIWGFISKTTISIVLIIILFADGEMPVFEQFNGTLLLIMVHMVLHLIWMYAASVTLRVNSYFRKQTNFMGFVLAILLFLTTILFKEYFGMAAETIALSLPEVLASVLSPWKLILSIIVLLGATIWMSNFSLKGFEEDSITLISLAGILGLTWILSNRYFFCGGIVVLLFALWSLRCIKNTYKGKKTMGIENILSLLLQFAGASVLIGLMFSWRWQNVLVTFLTGLLIYTYIRNHPEFYLHRRFWVLTILCMATETVIYLLSAGMVPSYLVATLIVTVAGIAVLLFLEKDGGMILPVSGKVMFGISCGSVFLAAIILYTLLITQNSVGINAETDTQSHTLTISIDENANISPEDLMFTWYDSHGEEYVSFAGIMKSYEQEIGIVSDRLVILVTEDDYIRYSRTIFIPYYIQH